MSSDLSTVEVCIDGIKNIALAQIQEAIQPGLDASRAALADLGRLIESAEADLFALNGSSPVGGDNA